jgi:hypothetical protein
MKGGQDKPDLVLVSKRIKGYPGGKQRKYGKVGLFPINRDTTKVDRPRFLIRTPLSN